MKKKLSLLMVALIAIAAFAAQQALRAYSGGSPYEYTFSTTEKTFTSDGTKELNGVDWTLAVTWKDPTLTDYNRDDPGGMKIGSNNKAVNAMSLTSAADGFGNNYITSVKVTTAARSGANPKLSVKVGTSDFKYLDGEQKLSSATVGTDKTKVYEFIGVGQGAIDIYWDSNASSSKGAIYVAKIEVAFQADAPAVSSVAEPSFSLDAGTYVGTQSVEITCATEGATIYYTTNGEVPTSASTQYTEALSISETTTIKAIAIKGDDVSDVATASYTILEKINGGSLEAPLTVADALALINENSTTVLSHPDNRVYVKALAVVEESAAVDTYGQLSYKLQDGTDVLDVYQGKYLDNVSFTAETKDAIAGKVVTVYGNVKKYNDTPEFDRGNYIVAIEESTPDMSGAEEWTVAAGQYKTILASEWADLPTTVPALVKFDGTAVAMQMTVSGITVTLVGTLDEASNTVTFPMNQTATYGGTTLYLVGTNGSEASDVVFAYDPTANKLTQVTALILASTVPSNITAALAQIQNVVLQGPLPEPEDIVISPATGTDIFTELTAAEEGKVVGNITINLAENGAYTVSGSIVAPMNVMINGNGATVDASGLTGNMVEYAEITEPTEWTEANVVITGLKVTGLNKALFYSKCKNYYGALTVDNCFVEQAGDATTIDYTKGSTAHTMTVTNSTFYALTATTKAFYSSQGGQKVTEWNAEAIQTFFFHNNTMYNLAKGKNFFSHRQSNQAWLTYNVQNNVFVNCGKSGQTIKGMNGGQSGANPTWTIGGNVFNFEGADTSANESTGDEAEPVQNCVAGIIAFTSVVDPVDFGGSFTMVDVTTAPNPFPGDPRWTVTPVTGYAVTIADGIENGTVTANPTLAAEGTTVTVTATPATGYELETITVTCVTSNEAVLVTDGQFTMPADAVVVSATFTKAPVNIEIADADITDGNISAAVAGKIAAIAEGDKLGDITITLDGEKSYTVTDPIVAPRNVTINGNGATVDASGLTGNMVEYAEITDPTEWTEANVVITGLKVTGLNKALFYSKCKNYYGTLTVDNCFVEQAGDATTIDYTKGSTATTLTVTNSTFYALTATTKSFYSSQGGQKVTEWNAEAIQTFFFHNNTMYNLAKGKNFFSHRQSNQAWLTYDVQNNVFVNCGKSGQTIKGMNGGQSGANPTWIIDGNAFNFEDADTSANESTGDEAEPVQNSVAGVMAFTSVVDPVDFGGVFTLAVGATAPETLGDPRWTITYENAPEIAKFYMIGDMNEWSRTAMTEMPFNAETQAYECEINNTKTLYFAFSDKQLTEEEESADPNWEDFNTNHRYAIGQGDQYVTLNEAMPLTKVEGTIVLKPVKEGTSYKISVAADFSTVTITGEAAPEPTEDTYVVAGCIGEKGGGDPDELFGTAWNPTAEANQMTKNEETGLYEKVYTGVVFEAQTGILYKIVKNGTQWMPDVDNLSVEIPAAGTYTITFTYNAETGDITGVAVPGADGIQMVNADKYGEGKWYTTSGVEVQKPTTKGLYIHNGKTVVVK